MSFNIDDSEPRRTRVRFKPGAQGNDSKPDFDYSKDWLEIAQLLLATLLPFPEARHAVVEALKARTEANLAKKNCPVET